MPQTVGSSTDRAQPRFYYDLASPESYFVAERALHAVGEVPEWIPVDLGGAFRCAAEVEAYKEDVERRAAALGVMPIRWPDPFPADIEWATLAATYAKWIGRGVAFSLAALRQAFAAGRDLSVPDNVLLAAAACEMHPHAVIKGVELETTKRALAEAHERAAADGIDTVPAIWVDGQVLAGERAIPVV
ncbi:DsbA family protein [Solirubrobacter sp. CPCC 204708]|uniref:DsbA family protein n=1 Tax=Solirubrobacter deserti TaxID=2282478 RepID=A0ABT4RKA2_9ACTN|nr:DsbA family protein [Solirubrobacter deserti]MBE2316822.1 DsbA family protein [Solirubrobacter deserti]MDA0138961.1 DsbA family protein [Solirubrobacter deserti]